MTALCLQYQDLVGGKLIRHRTLGKYLDAVNFPNGNANADPDQEIPNDQWFLERKSSETSTSVTWELSSALNFNGVQLPGRQIVANGCTWLSRGGYKGPYCGYSGSAYFDINDNAVSDPAKDVCGGRLSSCKARFGANNPLPYGSFPAAGILNQ
jgi:lambda family phage minor tail protein L